MATKFTLPIAVLGLVVTTVMELMDLLEGIPLIFKWILFLSLTSLGFIGFYDLWKGNQDDIIKKKKERAREEHLHRPELYFKFFDTITGFKENAKTITKNNYLRVFNTSHNNALEVRMYISDSNGKSLITYKPYFISSRIIPPGKGEGHHVIDLDSYSNRKTGKYFIHYTYESFIGRHYKKTIVLSCDRGTNGHLYWSEIIEQSKTELWTGKKWKHIKNYICG
ncbi:MAG: hypothetical protein FP824_07245 [Euryarchaeota archaeon]|nr:hypothetical protein [Euryarchaeota archaeon]